MAYLILGVFHIYFISNTNEVVTQAQNPQIRIQNLSEIKVFQNLGPQ